MTNKGPSYAHKHTARHSLERVRASELCVCVYGQLAQIPSGTRVHACPAMIITAKLSSVLQKCECMTRLLIQTSVDVVFPREQLNMDVAGRFS